MALPAARSVAAVALALVCTAGVSVLGGCSDSQSGPLQTVAADGQPIIGVGTLAMEPGQSADTTAYVTNSSDDPVTLVSASAVPVPGFAAGRLTHLAIATGRGAPGIILGWPPGVPVGPFAGATLRHGESKIVFAISGQRLGVDYAAAGIAVVYRYQGRVYRMTAWSGDLACVTTAKKLDKVADRCSNVGNRLIAAIQKLAG
jgi:hypothetical protein